MIELKASAYIFSGSICLSLAIILLSVRFSFSHQDRAFQRIKDFLAYSALIDVIIDSLVLCLMANNKDIFILDSFIIPASYYLQLYLMSKAILGMIHSESITMQIKSYLIPLLVLVILYINGYVIICNAKPLLSESTYNYYCSTLWSKSLSYALYLLICISTFYIIRQFITCSKLYIKKLNNYYSGTKVLNGVRISYFAWYALSYFLLAAFDFILSSDILDSVFMYVNTSIFISFVIFVFNIQNTYYSVQGAENFNIYDDSDGEKNPIEKKVESENNIKSADDVLKSIMTSIHSWETRTDKPYTKENLSVSDVSKELELTDIQLSFVLNHSMRINFSTWINQLRIQEAKRLISLDNKRSISEIAFASGFSDLNTFTRNFKKVTGTTPTSYKKMLRTNN